MIIELADSLFTSPGYAATLDLYHLFRLAGSNRHILLIKPAYDEQADASVNRWLARQAKEFTAPLRNTLHSGNTRFTAEISRVTLAVESFNAEPQWDTSRDSTRHRLPLALAAHIAATPLRLLVENRRNDAAFLRACIPPEHTERFRHAERHGWIRFEHAGGLGEMFHRVNEAGASGYEAEALRLSVIHDSDAQANYHEDGSTRFDDTNTCWGPRSDNARIAEACAGAVVSIDHHQLRRRTIENYLPGAMLERWANASDRRRRRALHAAFRSMSAEQRHYFNMKKGFTGDQKDRGICPLYSNVDEPTRRTLEQGFSDITSFFEPSGFRAEHAWHGRIDPELGPVIRTIFERM